MTNKRPRGDELNRAIAEAQGWVDIGDGLWGLAGRDRGYFMLPDYAHSEDACAEAEKVLRSAYLTRRYTEYSDGSIEEEWWERDNRTGLLRRIISSAQGMLDGPVRAWALLDALRALKEAQDDER